MSTKSENAGRNGRRAGFAALAMAWIVMPLGPASALAGSAGAEGSYLREREIFPGNVFTFVRVRYGGLGRYSLWSIDYPDSDINFSERLDELTTIEVAREAESTIGGKAQVKGKIKHEVLDLGQRERLFEYPFLYMVEVGSLSFNEQEVENLREYLLRGGFLHVDDFWGEYEWANWEYEIGRVFPSEIFPILDIPLSHEVFRIVFELDEVPQVPSLDYWEATGETHERPDATEPHVRGIFDRRGRLMVVMTHNTDLGDGWEREGENHEYFREFSAKKAYPLGINIVVYAMTH